MIAIQLHPAEHVSPRWQAFLDLAELQREGKVKHVGVSNFGVAQLQDALTTGVKIAANQLCYNLIFRAPELEIIPFCAANGIGVLAYSPLMQARPSHRSAPPPRAAARLASPPHHHSHRMRCAGPAHRRVDLARPSAHVPRAHAPLRRRAPKVTPRRKGARRTRPLPAHRPYATRSAPCASTLGQC
jgi:aryl-alcohol dehydrogenase-like predicted oxidoreductase